MMFSEIGTDDLFTALTCTFKNTALNELHCTQSDGTGLNMEVTDPTLLPEYQDSTFISDCVKVTSNSGRRLRLKVRSR